MSVTNKLNETLRKFDAKQLGDPITLIDELIDDVNTIVADQLKKPAEQLVYKLKGDQQLTDEDREMIKKWLVGDAEYYTRIENNLIDWVGECKRLLSVIENFPTTEIEEDQNKLLSLGAVLTDLKFTLKDVQRYSKAMNEVDKIKDMACIGTPNKETKLKLAELIEQKLETL